MSFSYANPNSGPSAGGIGWFNFGNLSMNPGDSVAGLTGTLSDGNIVTFDMSLALVSGLPRQFNAVTVPTYPLAQFGAAGYTGLAGNVAMYAALNDGNTSVSAFTISNITVKDPANNPVPNYTVLIGDAETTNLFEGISGQTNGGNWSLFTTVGSGGFPTLSGVGTQTFNIVGNQQAGAMVSYVLATQMPSQLLITMTDLDPVQTRQGFVIGFAVTRLTLQKNIGQRIAPSDQFLLDISGSPANQAVTSGTLNGIQPAFATVYASPGTAYSLNEAMAAGSVSALSDYTQTISSANATPAGSIPPVGPLPISFTPQLGDDVTYTILNAAPESFVKSVDKEFADVGEILTYTVTVDNPNDFTVNNVLVTDATPSGTTYIGNLNVSAPFTGTAPASGITITAIGPASSIILSWQVQVNSFPPIPNPVPNYANVSVPGGTTGMTNVVTTQVNTAYVTAIKTVDKAYASSGDVLTYTLTLNNAGNVPADNVVIADPLPAGTVFIPGSVTGATGTPPTLTLLNPIPAGGSATVTFKVQVGDTVPNPNPIPNLANITFTYTVNPANPDSSQGRTQSNVVTTQFNEAIVNTLKEVDKAFAAAGDILTYTLTLQNSGNVPADQVAITDAVPSGTSFVPGSVTGAAGIPPLLTLAAPIPPGGSAVVTFKVQIDSAIPSPNPVSNRADIAFKYTKDPQFPDGENGTNSSNTVNTQVNTAIVSTTKTVDKAFANAGDVLTYTLTLLNTGNTAADQVVISDPLPSGTAFLAGSLTGATGAPPLLLLPDPILPGDSALVTFQVQIGTLLPVPNPIPNTPSATFLYTVDPNIPDGAAGSSTGNTVFTQVNTADVTAVKTVDKAYAKPGDILTYSLTLQNAGNVAANQVTLTDAIPAGTSYVSGSLTGAAGTPPTLTLLTPLPAGGSAVISFQVKVNGIPNTNPIPNNALLQYVYTVDPQNPDGGSGGGRTNTVETQISVAVLTIEKATDKYTAYPGSIITYQFAVTNSGNTAAENVVLTDTLPNGLQFVPGTLTANVPVSGTPDQIVLANPIAAGATVNITFKVKVTAVPVPNPVINQGTVNYNYPVTPGEPNIPGTAVSNPVCTLIFRNNYLQQINDLNESAAMEQAALAAIINAEGAKIQKMAAMGTVTAAQLLCLNKSVEEMINSITLLESIIRQKQKAVSCQTDHSCL